MNEILLPAVFDSIALASGFVEEQLDAMDCPLRTRMQLLMATDELFTNIAMYAYGPEGGSAAIRVARTEDPAAIELTFTDRGKAYNPLEKKDPDVTLSAEERPIGGLGIFMVKKTVDSMTYERRDGCNVLTVRKLLP